MKSHFRSVVFFSLVPLATASIVDDSYTSYEDLYDAILNTFFPITFVLLFNVDRKSGTMKKKLLPLLDDVLYNTVTWVIPLTVSFAYNDSKAVKIFSIVNMCLHITCALIALINRKTIRNVFGNDIHFGIFTFLILFPVFVIPIFWIAYLATNHMVVSINLLFIILFGILLALIPTFVIMACCVGCNVINGKIFDTIGIIFYIICFYVPNILQTLLILLMWPINFYFVKSCVFVLVLSLTRNISYCDEVPRDFLATSTAIVQYVIRDRKKYIDVPINMNIV
jgi:hypothetical protein